jgi:hypothetical protein
VMKYRLELDMQRGMAERNSAIFGSISSRRCAFNPAAHKEGIARHIG